MPRFSYDRLSAQDNSFLVAETSSMHTHVASVNIFELGTLANESGGVDFEAVARATEAALHRIPRYRQKLRWIPLFDQPVWVDDPEFNLDYHMRHTSLPQPGGIDQLKRMSARIMSQQLDRSRPMWELWVVEGLEGGRFATIMKMHHCMIDGSAGADLAEVLLSITAEYETPEIPRYLPNPAPSPLELLRDEVLHRAAMPLRLAQGYRELRRESGDIVQELRTRGRAVGELLGWAMRSASETPLNGPTGPHRSFDWLSMPLADVKAVRKAAGCSVNDVVLTTVTGALRRYMQHRNVDPGELDFRVSAPVSVRRDSEKGQLGNRVSSWILRLPLAEDDPGRQLSAIHATTQELKESNQAIGIEVMMQIAEWTPPALLALGARAASGPVNTIVTNVPGPQFPLYMLGAKLLEMYPVVPLLDTMGLGFALFSYDGKLFWGFNADYGLVPDLDVIPRFVEQSFAAFAESVGVKLEIAPQEKPISQSGPLQPDA